MPKFEIVSEYQPAGDQPEAIEKLAQGIKLGFTEQTLLGVTGSGKTFTMANIIQKVQKPNYMFISCGGKEQRLVEAIDKAVPALKAAGYNVDGYVSEGTAHEFLSWRRSLNEFAQKIFK